MLTPNIAETLNQAGGDTVTLHLTSQSDCVLWVKGQVKRRRVAEGFVEDVPETLAIGPWMSRTLTPREANSPEAQTTRLAGKLRKTGPVRLGLTQEAPSGCQILRAHPRLRYVQPFQPLAAAAETPVSLAGLWLLLDAPPEAEARLSAQVTLWDARAESTGEPLARATATLTPGLSAYEAGPHGLLAAWIPFEDPWALDPDRQTLLHALTLSEIDGSAELVEAPLIHPRLVAARFRDAARSEVLATRRFAGGDKALLFDIGREVETATLSITSDETIGTVPADVAFDAFEITLPHAVLGLRANAAVEIATLSAQTSTTPS